MKHLITERANSLTFFVETKKMRMLCEIADFIDNAYPGCVLEVTHNRTIEQGSIIVKKDAYSLFSIIEEFIDNRYE